jgi:hypothetical protein
LLLDAVGRRRYVSRFSLAWPHLNDASPDRCAMDEQLKQQLMPALVVFNLTVGVYLLLRYFTSGRMFFGDFLMHLLVGAAIGLVTGGITLFFMLRKK